MPSVINAVINHNLPLLNAQGYRMIYFEREEQLITEKKQPNGLKAVFTSPDRKRCSVISFFDWEGQVLSFAEACIEKMAKQMEDLRQSKGYSQISCTIAFAVEDNVLKKETLDLYQNGGRRYGRVKLGVMIIHLPRKEMWGPRLSHELHTPELLFPDNLKSVAIDPTLGMTVKPVTRIYTQKPWLVYGLVLLNIILFALTFSPDPSHVVRLGALDAYRVWDGNYWVLLSAMGLHAGITHLIGNSIGLFLFGIKVEEFLGSARLFLIYLVAGLWGSFFCLLFHPLVPGLGASGAVFGLSGALLAVVFRNRQLWKMYLLVFIVNAVVSLILGALTPGVSTAAHMGGFIGGSLAVWAFGVLGDVLSHKRAMLILGLVTLTGVVFTIAVKPPLTGVKNICWQAYTAAKQKQFELSERLYKQAGNESFGKLKMIIDYKQGLIHADWGDYCVELESPMEAIEHYNKAIVLCGGEDARVVRGLMKAYEQIGDVNQAVRWKLRLREVEYQEFTESLL